MLSKRRELTAWRDRQRMLGSKSVLGFEGNLQKELNRRLGLFVWVCPCRAPQNDFRVFSWLPFFKPQEQGWCPQNTRDPADVKAKSLRMPETLPLLQCPRSQNQPEEEEPGEQRATLTPASGGVLLFPIKVPRVPSNVTGGSCSQHAKVNAKASIKNKPGMSNRELETCQATAERP